MTLVHIMSEKHYYNVLNKQSLRKQCHVFYTKACLWIQKLITCELLHQFRQSWSALLLTKSYHSPLKTHIFQSSWLAQLVKCATLNLRSSHIVLAFFSSIQECLSKCYSHTNWIRNHLISHLKKHNLLN